MTRQRPRLTFLVLVLSLLPAGVSALAASPPAIPQFPASERCSSDARSADTLACPFLGAIKPLEAPPGGRIYRETWSSGLKGPMGRGVITLTVYADGRRTLSSPWRYPADVLRPGELPDFEAALARSDFGRLPVDNQAEGACIDGVATTLEAVVDGRYRLTYFDYCGGVSSEGVALALDQLFVFAAAKAGMRYPVHPNHPTFRGR